MAHAFEDGNQRLGYIVAVIFLRQAGYPLPAEEALPLAKHIEAAVARVETVAVVSQWLRGILAGISPTAMG